MKKKQNQLDENEAILPLAAERDHDSDEDESSDEAVVHYVMEEMEGTLTAEKIAAFNAHIASCDQCLKTYTRMRAVLEVLRGKDKEPSQGPPIAAAGANGN